MAQPLADLRVTGINNETETRDEGQTENENESHQGPHEPPRENNARQKRTPYQQLAAMDMAQPLADLRVTGINNETETRDEGQTENENESHQGPHEPPRENNARQKRTPYQQLAADMAQPLADLRVTGDNNEN
ncbi:hypothetical protein OS493_024012 [Desmophyllum pertusum]|uniref:Uncharacterized protein n=1 Tax=Desmophyllum pertusum TaxID=174260 RepID=A0A9X0A0J8_9CNID|nr:hypothetical protein OS493_024012 [Desmophyllum pertusum]